MKAIICDFCQETTTARSAQVAYYVAVDISSGYEVSSEDDKVPLFTARDVCRKCALAASSALLALRRQIGGNTP